MGTRSNRGSQEDAKREELAGRRAVSIARAAFLYDVSKNTMRKILESEGVSPIKKGKVHRVLVDDLIRVMEDEIVPPAAPEQPSTLLTLSNADRAAFSRGSRGRNSS